MVFTPLVPSKRKSEEHHNDRGSKRVASDTDRFYMVQWRKPQYKKHKTWDGDAVLAIQGPRYTLLDSEGKVLGEGASASCGIVTHGLELQISGKEIEVEYSITSAEFYSGRCFGGQSAPPSEARNLQATATKPAAKPFVAPLRSSTSSSVSSRTFVQLEAVDLLAKPTHIVEMKASPVDSYWRVNWRNPQQKKNKTWDGDAFLSRVGSTINLISEEGKMMGSKTCKGELLAEGTFLHVSGKEVSLCTRIEARDLPTIFGTRPETRGPQPLALTEEPPEIAKAKPYIAPASFYSVPKAAKPSDPLHNPHADGAIVMKLPSDDHQLRFNKKKLPVVPVVVDPILSRHLRPHQVEGVRFLYECVMGLRKHEGNGCILADEMGMGKTLQTIALVWTLLKQNPYGGQGPVIGKALIVCPVSLVNNWKKEFHKWLGRDRIGVFVGDKDKTTIKQFMNSKIHHVLIIGYEKLRTVIADLAHAIPPIGLIICDEGHRLKSANNKSTKMFEALKTPRRIILSGTPIQNDLGEFHAMADFCNPGLLDDYSTFRRVYEAPILKSRAPDCGKKDLELGNARAAQLLLISKSFVLRRDASILNNYLPPKYEYTVFVSPTALQVSMFAKILQEKHLGRLLHGSTAQSLALINKLTKLSTSPMLLGRKAGQVKEGDQVQEDVIEDALALIPRNTTVDDFSLSGKLSALAALLRVLRQDTDEKCVVVSHYTSTLDIIESYCKRKKYGCHRLDGQTPMAKRQEYVDIFNRSSQSTIFVFLLSAKAGGVGLNLIGASRLVLVDSDWNPSHDLQSMARIHRDGQKRPVFIYRLLTAGTIDGGPLVHSHWLGQMETLEKIFQRQVTKMGLSDALMRQSPNEATKSTSDSFSLRDLRDLFTLYTNTPCHTHDLLDCSCDIENNPSPIDADDSDESDGEEDFEMQGFVVASQVDPSRISKASRKKRKAELASLDEWTHINCLRSSAQDTIRDAILKRLLVVPSSIDDGADEKAYATPPKSRLEVLLAVSDITNIDQPIEVQRREAVPPGVLTFLFERSSAIVEA